MPELVVDFITSLDGYASAEGWPGWWGLEGPEYLAWLGASPEGDYLVLMGANTYRLMHAFVQQGEPGTEVLTSMSKVVFSSTLTEPLEWENSTLVGGDAVEAVRRLKANGDRSMRTIGSLSLCRSLVAAGLVDRFRVVMFPVITGATGRERIYDGYPDVALDMVDSRTFDGQIQLVEYVPTVRLVGERRGRWRSGKQALSLCLQPPARPDVRSTAIDDQQSDAVTLPGLDLGRLSVWLPAAGVEAGPLSATLVAGGKSNLTYALSDGTHRWILRRPPLGHVLATAHDMSREYTVMSALEDTSVPVPRMYALCTDADVLGAPFYLMEHVDGMPYRFAAELEPLGPERTRGISERLVDTMAVLHAIDPVTVGLAEFGRADGFLARQVVRWKKQMDASHSRDLPAADELHARLAASVPAESAAGIVHGDYRLDNVLVDQDDRATAVLDWEMATLGDPLTDLALMLVYHRLGESAALPLVTNASSAPGFLSELEIVARYAAGSDRDLSHFGFYLGLAAYKLAAILEGIHFRYLKGQTVGEGFAGIGDAIHPLLDAGLHATKESY